MPIKGTYYNATLGAAPTAGATGQLGYSNFVNTGLILTSTSLGYFSLTNFTLPAGVWLLTGQAFNTVFPATAWLAFSGTSLTQSDRHVGGTASFTNGASWLQITTIFVQATTGTVYFMIYTSAVLSLSNIFYTVTRIA